MEKFICFLAILATCCASPQDLSGKVFTFPAESNTAHVRLIPTRGNFSSVTVCLRYFTDLTRNQVLFSLATPSHSNGFLLFKSNTGGQLNIFVQNQDVVFHELLDEKNSWVSVCGTWESGSGLVQPWINGKPGSRKQGPRDVLDGAPIIIVGQEQDSFGGGFDAGQSFVGLLADVHMWDYVLSYCEITRFANDDNFTPGNILNWRALEFNSVGNVVVENRTPEYCF
ncbi:mucosal pentraxin-like [Chanos chanos]|uniref:Pentraxin family member n=1 Tax=Chanos chanos TaxID=29144 RepID=A0A6J2V759_CHACN|nr:mucosal pentraxin-like [Chanos chanos]